MKLLKYYKYDFIIAFILTLLATNYESIFKIGRHFEKS